MRFTKSVLSLMGQDAIVSVLSLASSVVLARWLGPVAMGLFYIVNLIPAYAEKFGRLGVADHAAVYYIGQKKITLAQAAGHLTWISLALALFPIAFFVLFKNIFYVYFLKGAEVPLLYIGIAVGAIPLTYLFVAYNKLTIASGRIQEYNAIQVAKSFLFLVVILFCWLRGLTFWGAIVANVVAMAIAVFINGWLLYRATPFDWSLDSKVLKQLFGYGWKLYLINIIQVFHQRFDLLVVAVYLNPIQVTFYSMAVNIAQLLWKVPNAVSSILFPEVSRKKALDAAQFSARACRNTFTLLAAGALAAALTCTPVVYLLYGESFSPIIKPLLLILPGIVLMGLARVLTEHFYGTGHPKAVFLANFVSAPLNVVLNLWLIPKWGIAAAAAISSVTYSLSFFILVWGFRLRWKTAFPRFFIIDQEDRLYCRDILKSLCSRRNLYE